MAKDQALWTKVDPPEAAVEEPGLDELDFDPATWRGALDPNDGLPPDHP